MYEDKKLFNEQIKLQYIEERNKEVILPDKYLERQFKKISDMENELNKDLSNFTFYEIIEYYKLQNVSSLDSLTVMNSQFSLYTQWCLQKNLVKDNQNHFLEINIDIMKGCINKALFDRRIISREVILNWLEQLPNPKDQFVLLGLFEGIKGKDFCELLKIKPSDIQGNTISLCTQRKVKVSDKLISIINDCITEEIYYSISGSGAKTMPLIDRGYIIKDYPNAKTDVSDFSAGRKIYNSIIRILNYFDVLSFMTANSIAESGKIHMIKERSKELEISPKEYIYSNYIKEVEEQYNYKIVRSTFILKYNDYLE